MNLIDLAMISGAGAANATDANTPASLSFKRISRMFESREGEEIIALQDVDLAVAKGEFVAVVGPSGCGKSTLLALAAGLDVPTAGSVRIDGAALNGPRRGVATVFQNDHLLPWRTIEDNILLPLELRGAIDAQQRQAAADLLKQVGLAQFGRKYPHELSGGMRQRAAICRALIQQPDLLLMDEPFGALDALTREQMIADLQTLWLSCRNSVLFITHGIEEAVFLADRVIVMSPRPGRIALELNITLPRPRKWSAVHDDPEFHRFIRIIRETFEQQGVIH